MAHAAPPTHSDRVLTRLLAAIRYVLAMEPVAVAAIWRAVAVLLGACGLTVTESVDARVVAIIAAFYALVELLSTLRARSRSAAWASVVEKADGREVVAGPANELPTGAHVRELAARPHV